MSSLEQGKGKDPSFPETNNASFFISIEGNGDPVMISSDSVTEASHSASLSSSLPKNSVLEERLLNRQRQSRDPSLSSSPSDAHLRRTSALKVKQQRLAAEDRRKRETVAQVRRQQEREQREQWARMRERNFVVEYRREALRRVPRSKLLEAEVKTNQLALMASLITMTWLRSKMRPLTRDFLHCGILELVEEGSDYEKMQRTMMDQRNIVIATKLILKLTGCDVIASRLTRPQKAGRILLTALLLHGFGDQVMPEATSNELVLLEYAGQLTESLINYLTLPIREYQLRFAECWIQFCETFSVWQRKSQKALVQSMQEDYLDLAKIMISLGPQAKAEWQPHVQRHQEKLKKALKRVAGKQAIDDLNAKLRGLSIEEASDSRPELEFESKKVSPMDVNQAKSILGDDLSNIRIAHELMVDPSFDYAKLMAIKKKRTASLSSLDLSSDDLIGPTQVTTFIFEIKRQLLELVRSKGPVADELNESLEEEYICGLSSKGSLDLNSIFELFLNSMAKICAPIRDEMIESTMKAVRSRTEPLTNIGRQIIQILLLLHEDSANFGLTMVKPRVSRIIVPYEREWLAENVLQKPLTGTRKALKEILSKRRGDDMQPLELIHTSILEVLLHSLESSRQMHSIELLVLDWGRLDRIRAELKLIVVASALNLLLRNIRVPNIDSTMDHIIKLLMMKTDSVNIDNNILAEIENGLPPDHDDTDDGTLAFAHNILRGDDHISALIHKTVMDIIRRTLPASGTEFIHKPSSVLIRQGIIEPLTGKFNDILNELFRLYRLHREVTAPIYNQLIKEIQSEG